MKTAVSIPDELFQRAEDLARRLGKSRRQVYRGLGLPLARRRRSGPAALRGRGAGIDLVLGRE